MLAEKNLNHAQYHIGIYKKIKWDGITLQVQKLTYTQYSYCVKVFIAELNDLCLINRKLPVCQSLQWVFFLLFDLKLSKSGNWQNETKLNEQCFLFYKQY